MEIQHKEYKRQILRENFEEYCANRPEEYGEEYDETYTSIQEYVKREAESDPNFWYWLFDTEEDFYSCPDEAEFEQFLKTL